MPKAKINSIATNAQDHKFSIDGVQCFNSSKAPIPKALDRYFPPQLPLSLQAVWNSSWAVGIIRLSPPLVSRVPSWCTPVTPLWFRDGGGGTRYYFLYWEKTLLKWGPGTSAVWPKWSLIGLIGGATSKRWFSHGPIQFFWLPPIVR